MTLFSLEPIWMERQWLVFGRAQHQSTDKHISLPQCLLRPVRGKEVLSYL